MVSVLVPVADVSLGVLLAEAGAETPRWVREAAEGMGWQVRFYVDLEQRCREISQELRDEVLEPLLQDLTRSTRVAEGEVPDFLRSEVAPVIRLLAIELLTFVQPFDAT